MTRRAAGMAKAHTRQRVQLIEPKAGSKVAVLADVEKFYVDLLFALAEAR
jgi:hypothetical protein